MKIIANISAIKRKTNLGGMFHLILPNIQPTCSKHPNIYQTIANIHTFTEIYQTSKLIPNLANIRTCRKHPNLYLYQTFKPIY